MFPYVGVKCLIMVLESSSDLSENVSEGALQKRDFLKPHVPHSSRAGCQCGALEDHVKWVFCFLLVFFSFFFFFSLLLLPDKLSQGSPNIT